MVLVSHVSLYFRCEHKKKKCLRGVDGMEIDWPLLDADNLVLCDESEEDLRMRIEYYVEESIM